MQENAISCVLGTTPKMKLFLFSNNLIENNHEQKILEVIIDNKLNFKSHINKLCKKAQKIGALCRLSCCLNNSEKK